MLLEGTSRKSAIRPLGSVPDSPPPRFWTKTSLIVPEGSTGTSIESVFSSTSVTFVAGTPPTVTVAPSSKASPLRVAAPGITPGPDGGVREITKRGEKLGRVAAVIGRRGGDGRAVRQCQRKDGVEGRVARGVGRDRDGPEIRLPLRQILRPGGADGAAIEVEVERRRGGAVAGSGHRRRRAAVRDGADDRVVLEPVGPGVPISRVVEGHAGSAVGQEVDAEPVRRGAAGVVEDRVASNRDTGGSGVAGLTLDDDSCIVRASQSPPVVRDEISFPGLRTADQDVA